MQYRILYKLCSNPGGLEEIETGRNRTGNYAGETFLLAHVAAMEAFQIWEYD